MAGERGQLLKNGEHVRLIALENGRTVASLITGVDRRANRISGDARGYFAKFETEDSQAAVSALFTAAARYQAALGMRKFVGPCPLDGSGFMMGVLALGGNELLNPHNPYYYNGLILGAGLAPLTQWLSYDIDINDPALDRYVSAAEWASARHGYNVEALDLGHGRAAYEELYRALEVGGWLSLGEFGAQLEAVSKYYDRRLLLVARKQGAPCGMMLGLHDRRTRAVRVATVHVAKGFRRSPVLVALAGRMIVQVRKLAPKLVTISVIDSDNQKSAMCVAASGAVLARKYMQYEMII